MEELKKRTSSTVFSSDEPTAEIIQTSFLKAGDVQERMARDLENFKNKMATGTVNPEDKNAFKKKAIKDFEELRKVYSDLDALYRGPRSCNLRNFYKRLMETAVDIRAVGADIKAALASFELMKRLSGSRWKKREQEYGTFFSSLPTIQEHEALKLYPEFCPVPEEHDESSGEEFSDDEQYDNCGEELKLPKPKG